MLQEVKTLIEQLLAAPRSPISNIPERQGAYFIYDKNGSIICVGKGKKIRRRIQADQSTPREPCAIRARIPAKPPNAAYDRALWRYRLLCPLCVASAATPQLGASHAARSGSRH